MLRSLVGSEMCIRDSVLLQHLAALAGAFDDAEAGLDHQLLRRGAGRHATCLLYTSDAADDLLCVDLGGRRIIKKKTTKKTIERYNTSNTKKHMKLRPRICIVY